MSKYKAFFAAFKASQQGGNPYSREEVISTFTDGRTSSLKELTPEELASITRRLNDAAGFDPTNPQHQDRADKMRKAIIAIFYKMERTPDEAKAWAEKQGVTGEKRAFNDYKPAELFILIRVAEKILADYQIAIRKSLAR